MGLVEATGHISARIPGTESFIIPPRSSPAFASRNTLLVMDVDGHLRDGDGEPNSEHWIHGRIYAARPDVGAVAHVHAPSCVVLGQIGQTVRAIHNPGALFDAVPMYGDVGLIRSASLGDVVASTLGGARAMLLRGHGANVVATDVRRVTVLAYYLEEAASRQLMALAAVGGVPDAIQFYSESECDRVSAELDAEAPYRRTWDYYAATCENGPKAP